MSNVQPKINKCNRMNILTVSILSYSINGCLFNGQRIQWSTNERGRKRSTVGLGQWTFENGGLKGAQIWAAGKHTPFASADWAILVRLWRCPLYAPKIISLQSFSIKDEQQQLHQQSYRWPRNRCHCHGGRPFRQ